MTGDPSSLRSSVSRLVHFSWVLCRHIGVGWGNEESGTNAWVSARFWRREKVTFIFIPSSTTPPRPQRVFVCHSSDRLVFVLFCWLFDCLPPQVTVLYHLSVFESFVAVCPSHLQLQAYVAPAPPTHPTYTCSCLLAPCFVSVSSPSRLVFHLIFFGVRFTSVSRRFYLRCLCFSSSACPSLSRLPCTTTSFTQSRVSCSCSSCFLDSFSCACADYLLRRITLDSTRRRVCYIVSHIVSYRSAATYCPSYRLLIASYPTALAHLPALVLLSILQFPLSLSLALASRLLTYPKPRESCTGFGRLYLLTPRIVHRLRTLTAYLLCVS